MGPGKDDCLHSLSETGCANCSSLRKDWQLSISRKRQALRHPGGLAMELASIYSVVNSLTQNVGKIGRVQILIEGAEAETLAGHIDLSHPFSEDLSMTVLGGTAKSSASP